MTVKYAHHILRERLLRRAGLIEPPAPRFRLEDLQRSEWSSDFERLMRNRLLMGALRYGPLRRPGKPQYDRVGSMLKRLHRYRDTGNLEYLVDVANLCLCEFVEGQHPNRHFHALDDSEHVKPTAEKLC
jgi:hypothetical protein